MRCGFSITPAGIRPKSGGSAGSGPPRLADAAQSVLRFASLSTLALALAYALSHESISKRCERLGDRLRLVSLLFAAAATFAASLVVTFLSSFCHPCHSLSQEGNIKPLLLLLFAGA